MKLKHAPFHCQGRDRLKLLGVIASISIALWGFRVLTQMPLEVFPRTSVKLD